MGGGVTLILHPAAVSHSLILLLPLLFDDVIVADDAGISKSDVSRKLQIGQIKTCNVIIL